MKKSELPVGIQNVLNKLEINVREFNDFSRTLHQEGYILELELDFDVKVQGERVPFLTKPKVTASITD